MAASAALSSHEEGLVSICGEAHVERKGAELVVAPADEAQASQVLRYCDQKRIPVNVQGAGTKQGWLDAPRSGGARLVTRRMSRVIEHVWQDMTCTVQAGCTWQELQRSLLQHGQFVALDPLWPGRATVGGVVAANDSGALRLRYGGLRDLLIGMTTVLADGTIARSGGKVVKNVAGYDLPKLLCGSFGTLGLITEMTFRLYSVAACTRTLTAASATAGPLGKLLLRLLDLRFSLQSMQLRSEAQGFALDVRLSATAEVLDHQSDTLNGIAGSFGLTAQPTSEDVWSFRETLFRESGDAFVFKASVLPTAIGPLAQEAVDAGGSFVAQATGLAVVRVPRAAAQLLLRMRASVEAANGSLVLLQIPPGADIDRWGTRPAAWPLMSAVKQQFDPLGTLNPGRYLGLTVGLNA